MKNVNGTGEKPKRRSPCVYINRRGPVAREELLRALQFTVFEKGWRGATIREIAQRAGVSVSTVHHHFASREEMARSIYEDICVRTHQCVELLQPAPLETLFTELVRTSIEQFDGLGELYVDAFAQSIRAQRPLPTLSFTFLAIVSRATDLPTDCPPIAWLLEQTHRTLIEWRLTSGSEELVLRRATEAARAITHLSWTNSASEIERHEAALVGAVGQFVGTPWHEDDMGRMLTHGLPSKNPRRKRESARRRGAVR